MPGEVFRRIAVFGGVYSNYLALEATIRDAHRRGAEALYCLGDLGAFGPHPDHVFPILKEAGVRVMRGNYDDSIGRRLDDCQCGYTDPRDNYFAKISYEYTLDNTREENRARLRELPGELRVSLGEWKVYMCHGSPRRINEFLWESATPDHFIGKLMDAVDADVVLATHTGLHWHRQVGPRRHFVNVGVIGRPANDGRTDVWYTLLEAGAELSVRHIPVAYDYRALAEQMRREGLPEEFCATILTGWWTTCLEILPQKERRCGKF